MIVTSSLNFVMFFFIDHMVGERGDEMSVIC